MVEYSEEYIDSLTEAEEFDPGMVAVFQEAVNAMQFVKKTRNSIRDKNETSSYSSMSLSRYKKSDVNTYLENPENNEKNLRDLSRYLYNTSSQYRRLLQYFSQMLMWSYVIYPLDIEEEKITDTDKFLAAYRKAKKSMGVINVAHEFSRVMEVALRDGIYYGYVNETKDSFQFWQLDPDYCAITAREDGCYTFQFDLSYFNSRESQLALFPSEFERARAAYKNRTGEQWFELESKKSICIKADESVDFPIPPYVSLFSTLSDIEDYRAISKDASESINYKVVYLKMPVDEKGHLKVPKPLCIQAYNSLLSILPEGVGAFLTPLEVDNINFKQNTSLDDTSLVVEAENNFWRAAGVNALMFGAGDDPSSYALETSIHSDEAVCFRILRQFERWCNSRLKQISGIYKFQAAFLDVTRFNYKSMLDTYLKMGQYGRPVRQAIDAAMGYTPTMTAGLSFLENDILHLYDREVPLQSSNTMSSDDVGGRPTNESQGKPLSESGERTADSGANQNRVKS